MFRLGRGPPKELIRRSRHSTLSTQYRIADCELSHGDELDKEMIDNNARRVASRLTRAAAHILSSIGVRRRPIGFGLVIRLASLALLALLVGVAGQAPANEQGTGASDATRCRITSGESSQSAGASVMVVTPGCWPSVARFQGSDIVPVVVMVRDPRPRVGEPCRDLHSYAVQFTADADGRRAGVFAFAGGATSGSLPLTTEQAMLVADHRAYVTDVQLGSYEPIDNVDQSGRLTCRLDRTFHFYCPATDGLDQLCFTWVARRVSPPLR